MAAFESGRRTPFAASDASKIHTHAKGPVGAAQKPAPEAAKSGVLASDSRSGFPRAFLAMLAFVPAARGPQGRPGRKVNDKPKNKLRPAREHGCQNARRNGALPA